ncbi:MAG TPA: hypothetical protein VMF06_11235 [Candidatus Limnocylindria bacterium]|nr:hypothetical protein [Candidatus Limnocylindria bacterium]
MNRLLVIACDALDARVLSANHPGWFPCLTQAATRGIQVQCAPSGPALANLLWGDLATARGAGFALPAVGLESPDGLLVPVTSSDWKRPAPWDSLSQGTRSQVVVNWPGTYPVRASSIASHLVSDGWFADPAAPQTSSTDLLSPEDLDSLRVSVAGLDSGLLRLLLPDLTAAEIAADSRTSRLADALAQLYSQLNVAVTLLSSADWNEAWIRIPFLAEVVKDFGTFCSITGSPGNPPELGRRYRNVFALAHRLVDSALSQILAAAGPETHIGIFGGWSRREGGRNRSGPLSILHERASDGLFLATGPDLHTGSRPDGTAVQCLAWLRNRGGIVRPEPHYKTSVVETHPRMPDSIRRGLLHRLVADGTLRERDLDIPGAGRFWSQATPWFDAAAAFEAGDPESALPKLLEIWEKSPELHDLTQVLGYVLVAIDDRAGVRRCINILRDDGPASPGAAITTATLALAIGDSKVAEQVLATSAFDPHDPALIRLHAALSLQRGEANTAFQEYGDLLRRDARDELAWTGLVQCYLSEYRYTDAADAVAHARGLLPESIALSLLEVELLEASGSSAEALALLERLQARYPAHPLIRQASALRPDNGIIPSRSLPLPDSHWEAADNRPPARFQIANGEQRFRFEWLPGSWMLNEHDSTLAWFAENPRRLAGLASWRQEGDLTRLKFMVRHQWHTDERGIADFLNAVVTAIRNSTPLGRIGVTVPTFFAEHPALKQLGFVKLGCDQMWIVEDIPAVQANLNRRAGEMFTLNQEIPGWTVRDAVPGDLSWLKDLWGRPGLLSAGQISDLLRDARGWMALVAEQNGVPAGAVLLYQRGLELVLQVENAVIPRFKDRLGFKLAIYRTIVQRCQDLGLTRVSTTTNPATNRRVINTLASLGAEMVFEGHHYVLPPPSADMARTDRVA